MNLPKIGILKKVDLNNRGHYRFYSANYNPEQTGKLKKSQRPKMPMINLLEHPEITTEKEFLKAIYNSWGAGTYMCLGYVKGKRGTWLFWYGKIDERGFLFFKKEYNKKDVISWKKDMDSSTYEEEKETYRKLMEDAKESSKEENKHKRYGFSPYLKPSGRRGQLILWEEIYNPSLEEEIIEEKWEGEVKEKKKFEDWGEPIKKKEFEKW